MPLDERGDRRDQLGQGGAQRHKRQRDNTLGHAQRLRDQRAVVHQKVCAHRDQHRAGYQQHQHLRQGHGFFLVVVLLGGGVFHLYHVGGHVRDKHRQHNKAHRAGELAKAVGRHAVDGRRGKEEQHRHFQRLRVNFSRAHRNGDGRDQRRIADDRPDGVAVGDLAMAGQRRHRRDHDLGQGGADGHDRRADEQLGQMEPPRQRRRAVHEPVAALDEEQQPDNKQQYRDQHKNSFAANGFLRIFLV